MSVYLLAPFKGAGHLTQRFGERPEVYRRFGYPAHNGLDIGYAVNTPVVAVAAGEVSKAGYDPGGYGEWCELRHDFGLTRYAHGVRGSLRVMGGRTVKAGEALFLGDSTGFSTGNHLHFELHTPSRPQLWVPGYRDRINPLPFLPGTIGGGGHEIGDDVNGEIGILQRELQLQIADSDRNRADKLAALVDLGIAIRAYNGSDLDKARMDELNAKWKGKI